MDEFERQLVLRKEVRFSGSRSESHSITEDNFGDVFGGIIKAGQWGWITKGSSIRITALRTGQLISKFIFDESYGFGACIITCVSEIHLPYLTDTVICIGVQYTDRPGGLAVIYCVEQSQVIRCIELMHKITCCKFISLEIAQHTVLQNMNGCMAVGTDGGSVLLVDLNLCGGTMKATSLGSEISVVPCHIVEYSISVLHLHRHFQHCQQEGVHFGIQLEVLENADFIQSLLPVDLILSLAVGLADGRLVLYDLSDMQVFYVAPPQEKSSPLVKMNFMEPPDDPRSCVYIWAFHENKQNSMAVMHSLMYEKRMVDLNGFGFFENFQVACVRLLLPLGCLKSVPITCQAITKAPSNGNEEIISLCALAWKQDQKHQTEVLLFDINQWYKEEMPYIGDWKQNPSYLASFVLKDVILLEMCFNANTISLFNSIHRPEEHFYPVSLSFDSIGLTENSCVHLNWSGAQNQVIDVLRYRGPLALLNPNLVFNAVVNTGLLPQFCGFNATATFSLKAKREILLSVALEQNCIGLLKDCAKKWSDGSHQGKSKDEGLTISTLTNWLWARALSIKDRCNDLCQVLFDHSGCALDQREQKELGYISKQLKTLAELLSEINSKYSQNIPPDVLTTLESQNKSIRMASEYQEILLWLLNIGLLPEASRLRKHSDDEYNHVPYPYESLRRFYENRRLEFSRLNQQFLLLKTRSCCLLFIDSFIEHVFKSNSLWDSWQESGGNGLYPPTSIQAMLRIMLIPEVNFENKCALFLYLFLDLNMAIEDKQYESIVQNFIKFPSVFKLSASLIKQIQAFWNLDHCRFQAAIDEFISPFNKDQVCPQWQVELFLESLLAQNESNLSLRVLEANSSPISPVLQLNTYLANDLFSEAFHFARSKQDCGLLKLFFTGCLCNGKFGVIRDLALTEKEGNLVQSLLKHSKSRNAENLHFVFLLQKYKYIEAVSYLDEISKERGVKLAVDVDTPTLVLSAYNTTMTPVMKSFSDVYFKMKNKIRSRSTEQNSPYPLSCQLIKQNANELLGGIYHSSALSAHFASHYWERHQGEDGNLLHQSTNAPFLRRPQVPSSYMEFIQKESISYPEQYTVAQKRRLENILVEEEKASKLRDNPKKRRKVYDQSNWGAAYISMRKELLVSDSLITHFKSPTVHAQEISNISGNLQKTLPQDSVVFLETPFVKNTIVDALGGVTSNTNPENKQISLQGILKVSHLNQTPSIDGKDNERSASADVESEKKGKKDPEDEEKGIRFILPPVERESKEHINDEDIPIESENRDKKLEETLSQSYRRHALPSKRKSLRSCRNFTSNDDLYQTSKEESYFKVNSNTNAKNQNVDVKTIGSSMLLDNINTEDSYGKPFDYGMDNSRTTSDDCDGEASKKQPISKMSETKILPIKLHDLSVSPANKLNLGTEHNLQTVLFEVDDKNMNFKIQVEDKNTSGMQKTQSIYNTSNEAPYSSNHSGKELKGRASIHSPVSDNAVYKTLTSSGTTSKSSLGNILKSDTIIDFKPPLSSSRVCETESKFNIGTSEIMKTSETTSKTTFSERSTILGGLSYLPILESTQQLNETISVTSLLPRNKMLDTTVDMTLYDTTNFEKCDQQQPSENSTSVNIDFEQESTSSDLNVFNDPAVQSKKNNGDSDSVILLSSRSNSPIFFGESSEYSETRSQEPTTTNILINDEEDDDVINIVEKYNDGSEDSFSSRFSEVTRTSTSCSVLSNPDTVLSSTAESVSKESDTTQMEALAGDVESYGKKAFEKTANDIPVVTKEREAETSEDKVENNEKEIHFEPETSIVLFVKEEEIVGCKMKDCEQKMIKLGHTSEKGSSTTVILDQPEKLSTKAIEKAKIQMEKEQTTENITSQDQAIQHNSKMMESNLESANNQNKDTQSNSLDEFECNPQRRRSKSFSKTLISEKNITDSPSRQKLSRGGSVPPSSTSQIVTRRRSLLLETLDENVTPDSPSSRTRSKLRSDSIDVEYDTPLVSNVKRSRLSSISSVMSTELSQTSKARRKSNTSVDVLSSPKTAGTPRPIRAKSVTAVTVALTTSPIMKPRLSISKMSETSVVHSIKDEPIEQNSERALEITQSDGFRSVRRLTRTQLAVMEKSAALTKRIPISPARVTRRRSSRASETSSPPEVKESDTESLSSQVSQSSRRITRSSVLKENADEDRVSIASSTEGVRAKRKREKEMSSPAAALTVIAEEGSLNSEESNVKSDTSKKLTRPNKNKSKNAHT